MAVLSTTSLRVSDAQISRASEQLGKLVAIPSVSNPKSPDYNMQHLEAAAQFCGTNLKELGFDVRLVRIENSAPFVIAKRTINKNLPTVTVYAHYDVQPPDRSHWNGDPFALQERDGRLYGRGATDDKGGIIAILTAFKVYQDAGRQLPVNVNILFEGEEEYDSTHMTALLKQEAENLNAMALVVLDAGNISTDTGTLTSSTRGVVDIKLRVDALKAPVHSGTGVLVPCPVLHLAKLVATLPTVHTAFHIPGFLAGSRPIDPSERKLLRESSQTKESYREEMGVLNNVKLQCPTDLSIYEGIVQQPSIAVLNFNAGMPDGGNSIQAYATATIGIRTLPGQDPDAVARAVMSYLADQNQQLNVFGFEVNIHQPEAGAWSWKANFNGPFSTAYRSALEANFPKIGTKPTGGALPLLREFELAFPGIEIIAPGVEDPACAMHSDNESQHLGVWRRAMDSFICFLDKAGKINGTMPKLNDPHSHSMG